MYGKVSSPRLGCGSLEPKCLQYTLAHLQQSFIQLFFTYYEARGSLEGRAFSVASISSWLPRLARASRLALFLRDVLTLCSPSIFFSSQPR